MVDHSDMDGNTLVVLLEKCEAVRNVRARAGIVMYSSKLCLSCPIWVQGIWVRINCTIGETGKKEKCGKQRRG